MCPCLQVCNLLILIPYNTLIHKEIFMNTSTELNETNYCDQTPVSMEFSFEEHDLLNNILNHALDGIHLAIPCIYDLPEDSESLQRYEMLEHMKNHSYSLWANRFGN